MRQIYSLIGFFLPMLTTVTVDHLIKQPIAGEVIDSIISALFFTAVFAVGVWLGQGLKGKPSRWKGFLHGLAAGIVVQAVIWGFWLSMSEAVRYSFGIWPLVGHVLLIIGVGYTMSRVQVGDMSGHNNGINATHYILSLPRLNYLNPRQMAWSKVISCFSL